MPHYAVINQSKTRGLSCSFEAIRIHLFEDSDFTSKTQAEMNFFLEVDRKIVFIGKLRTRLKYLLDVRELFITKEYHDLIECHFEGTSIMLKKNNYDIDILWFLSLLNFLEDDSDPVEFICTQHDEPIWIKKIVRPDLFVS
ncbi:MAG: hypothetical protein SFW07_02990 [Gammaproteobacteria bacterium]|nr:hypothetical protein [Gammaproteobacteria bacterium]